VGWGLTFFLEFAHWVGIKAFNDDSVFLSDVEEILFELFPRHVHLKVPLLSSFLEMFKGIFALG
jgi:hypothetical protein